MENQQDTIEDRRGMWQELLSVILHLMEMRRAVAKQELEAGQLLQRLKTETSPQGWVFLMTEGQYEVVPVGAEPVKIDGLWLTVQSGVLSVRAADGRPLLELKYGEDQPCDEHGLPTDPIVGESSLFAVIRFFREPFDAFDYVFRELYKQNS